MSETNGQNGTALSVESFALGGVSYAAACDNPLSERFTPGKAMTEGYRPGIIQNVFNPRMPLFSLGFIDWMLLDPTVQLGLRMIKGPIYTCKAFVESDPEAEKFTGPKLTIKSKDKQVAAFVASNINRFWQGSLRKVLSMVEYGTSAGEVTYRLNGDMLHFDELRDVKLFDARVLTDKENSRFLGVSINNIAQKGKVQIPHPKAWWSIHDRKYTRWYGQSRLYGAFAPWWEKTTEGGAIDVRRLWFYKNAYDSGTMRHPDGNSDVNGVSTPNRDIARQYVEERRTGHVGVLPSTRYPSLEGGGYMWETDEPKLNGSAEDIRENVKDIDGEIYRGMGIPPEVVQSDGTGSYSGRLVPQSAFYSSLEDLLNDLLATLRERILDPLVVVNFGHIEYEIQTDPLAPDDSQQGPQMPPQAGGQGGQPPQQPGGAGGGPGSWVPFSGARGGQGEKNTATGAVRYSHPHRTDNGELFAIRMSIVGPAAPDYDGPPDQPENKIPLVDRIIKEGLDAAFDAIAGLRRRLREELGPLVDAGHPPDFILFEARRIILEAEPELAQTLSDTLLASWVAGASEVAEDIPAEVLTEIQLTRVYHQIPPEPPEITTLLYPADEAPRIRFPLIEQAAKSLAERQILSKEDFQTLSVEAKRAAFTVAGQDSIETVGKIRDVLTELVQEGPTLAKFNEVLDAKVFGGESPMAPWHQEVVYRNNVQESYSAGLDRILNDPLVVDAFPYEADDSIRDARRSEICEWFATNGIDGTNIYRADDPLYQKLRAPRHHNCRTGRRPMTIQMAADKGISEAKDWLESGRKPTNPFRMEMPPAKLLKGTFYGASGSQGMRFALADEDDAIKAIVAAFEAGELTLEEAVEAYQAILEDDVPPDGEDAPENAQRFAWTGPHTGPRGGVYWLNDETGSKTYRKTKPGTGRELWTAARKSLGVKSQKGLDAYRGAREIHAQAMAGKITVEWATEQFKSMLEKFDKGIERKELPPKKEVEKKPESVKEEATKEKETTDEKGSTKEEQTAKEKPNRDTATPKEVLDIALENIGAGYISTPYAPVWKIREQVADQIGDKAASHEVLDGIMKQMHREGKIRLTAIADRSRSKPEHLRAGIEGSNETFYYVEIPEPEHDHEDSMAKSREMRAENKTWASPSERDINHAIEKVAGAGSVETEGTPIWAVRQAIKSWLWSDESASKGVDQTLKALHKAGKIKLLEMPAGAAAEGKLTKEQKSGGLEIDGKKYYAVAKGEGKPKKAKPSSISAKLPGGKSVEFIPHEKAKNDEYDLIEVDPKKLDAAWRANHDNYLPPEGEGKGKSEVAGRREGFKEFLAKGEPIQASMVEIAWDGSIDFTDGRHRARVLMDAGIDKIAVNVPKGRGRRFKQLIAEAESKTSVTKADEGNKPKADPEADIQKISVKKTNNLHKRYKDAKSQAGGGKDSIVLFKRGDFYELFFDDATFAEKNLGFNIVTKHEKGKPDVPMAGLHAPMLESYIKQLANLGKSVSIAEYA